VAELSCIMLVGPTCITAHMSIAIHTIVSYTNTID
jgi:hypothetical protein